MSFAKICNEIQSVLLTSLMLGDVGQKNIRIKYFAFLPIFKLSVAFGKS